MSITINQYAKENGYKKPTVYNRLRQIENANPEVEITVKQGNKFILTDAGIALLDKSFNEKPLNHSDKTHIESLNESKEIANENVKSDAKNININVNELDNYLLTFFNRYLSENEVFSELLNADINVNETGYINDLELQLTELIQENINQKHEIELLKKDIENRDNQIKYLEDSLKDKDRQLQDKDKLYSDLNNNFASVLQSNLMLTSQQQGINALRLKSGNEEIATDAQVEKKTVEAEIIEPENEKLQDSPPLNETKRKSFWSRLFSKDSI